MCYERLHQTTGLRGPISKPIALHMEAEQGQDVVCDDEGLGVECERRRKACSNIQKQAETTFGGLCFRKKSVFTAHSLNMSHVSRCIYANAPVLRLAVIPLSIIGRQEKRAGVLPSGLEVANPGVVSYG